VLTLIDSAWHRSSQRVDACGMQRVQRIQRGAGAVRHFAAAASLLRHQAASQQGCEQLFKQHEHCIDAFTHRTNRLRCMDSAKHIKPLSPCVMWY
jgi:hypothetical protein